MCIFSWNILQFLKKTLPVGTKGQNEAPTKGQDDYAEMNI